MKFSADSSSLLAIFLCTDFAFAIPTPGSSHSKVKGIKCPAGWQEGEVFETHGSHTGINSGGFLAIQRLCGPEDDAPPEYRAGIRCHIPAKVGSQCCYPPRGGGTEAMCPTADKHFDDKKTSSSSTSKSKKKNKGH